MIPRGDRLYVRSSADGGYQLPAGMLRVVVASFPGPCRNFTNGTIVTIENDALPDWGGLLEKTGSAPDQWGTLGLYADGASKINDLSDMTHWNTTIVQNVGVRHLLTIRAAATVSGSDVLWQGERLGGGASALGRYTRLAGAAGGMILVAGGAIPAAFLDVVNTWA